MVFPVSEAKWKFFWVKKTRLQHAVFLQSAEVDAFFQSEVILFPIWLFPN
jgi:hypothetical protein